MTDLVPADLISPDIDTEYEPRRLLDELAEELASKTGGQIMGEVQTLDHPDQRVRHAFLLRTGSGYGYVLFSVVHGIDEYPLVVNGPGQMEEHQCSDRQQFEARLKQIFGDPRTRKLINQLVRAAS